jgi:hypothetical protein
MGGVAIIETVIKGREERRIGQPRDVKPTRLEPQIERQ